MKASILFPIKEEKYSNGGLGRSDKAISQVDFDVSLEHF